MRQKQWLTWNMFFTIPKLFGFKEAFWYIYVYEGTHSLFEKYVEKKGENSSLSQLKIIGNHS